MKEIERDEITIVGIKLNEKTSNIDNRSQLDIGNLWERFEKENITSQIPTKKNNDIVAVYFDYDGDYREPFSYLIGFEVSILEKVPVGLTKITIPQSKYLKFTARGKMPDCISETWQTIWKTKVERAYKYDIERYSEKSWNKINSEDDIFISIGQD